MSRLDSFIRRLEAQRACLNMAAKLVRKLEGAVLELGLGNGRTYDHLRKLFPDRRIFVCERAIAAHPDCVPPLGLLLLGDMRDTLPAAYNRLAGKVAVAHLDAGDGDSVASKALADELTPMIIPLLRCDGLLVSEPELTADELRSVPLPNGVEPGRYNLYRRVSSQRSP